MVWLLLGCRLVLAPSAVLVLPGCLLVLAVRSSVQLLWLLGWVLVQWVSGWPLGLFQESGLLVEIVVSLSVVVLLGFVVSVGVQRRSRSFGFAFFVLPHPLGLQRLLLCGRLWPLPPAVVVVRRVLRRVLLVGWVGPPILGGARPLLASLIAVVVHAWKVVISWLWLVLVTVVLLVVGLLVLGARVCPGGLVEVAVVLVKVVVVVVIVGQSPLSFACRSVLVFVPVVAVPLLWLLGCVMLRHSP